MKGLPEPHALPSGFRFFCVGRRAARIPVQARFRSDKRAAVLTLQRTQRKDRRVYTAFTGILAARRPTQKNRKSEGGHAAQAALSLV